MPCCIYNARHFDKLTRRFDGYSCRFCKFVCHSDGVGRRAGNRRHLLCVIVVAVACLFCVPTSASAADKLDKYDSAYVSTLNMTDEEIAELYGVDSTQLNEGPTLQELNEENPSYVKREYNHRQQVIVGSVVMLCVAIAMVLMNNYNPKR